MALIKPTFDCMTCPAFVPTPLAANEGSCRFNPPYGFLVPGPRGEPQLLSAWPTVKRGQSCMQHPKAMAFLQSTLKQAADDLRYEQSFGAPPRMPAFALQGPAEPVPQPAAPVPDAPGEDPRMKVGLKDVDQTIKHMNGAPSTTVVVTDQDEG